jgi:hypothetical protein
VDITFLGKALTLLHSKAGKASEKYVFLIAFLYTFFAALFVQVIFLPTLRPDWHAGHGLLIGLDSIRFHQMAVDLAEQIKLQGWSAWQLRPDSQAPAGIAAAVYALTWPEPWTLIPLSAALHALAATTLWEIILLITKERWIATASIVPFVVFPSSLQWTSQIHKDGWSIAGGLLTILGWMVVIGNLQGRRTTPAFMRAGILLALGLGLAWIPRPYNTLLILGASLPIILGVVVFYFYSAYKTKRARRNSIVKIALLAGVFGLLGVLSIGTYSVSYEELPPLATNVAPVSWKPSKWLPAPIDDLFQSLAATRFRYINGYPDARTNIDTQVVFDEALDVMAYVPRATVILLFSPFPNAWFGEGSLEPNTLMRTIASVETMVNYVCLAGLLVASAFYRKDIRFWCVVAFCYLLILPQGLVVANIGTLYRFRFGGYMAIMALGLAGLLTRLSKKSQKT